jgi:putative heme transporter
VSYHQSVTAVCADESRRRSGGRLAAHATLGLLLVIASITLIAVVPLVAHSSWSDVVTVITAISPMWLIALTSVWLIGLWVHTLVLTASLPGLTSRQALSLNLAGSAVSNAIPLGGPASLGLITTMARSWGFGTSDIGAFLTVSNLWNIAARLGFGALGLGWWAVARPSLGHGGVVGAVFTPIVVLFVVGCIIVASSRLSAWAGNAAGTLVDIVDARRGRPHRYRQAGFRATALAVRRLSLNVTADSWRSMSAGMVMYLMSLCLLLDLCLRALGNGQSLVLVVAAVAVERLLSAVPVTPGGSGVADLGLAASLSIAGVSPVVSAGAALLYRLFTFGLEIPVGLAVSLGWGLRLRQRRATAATVIPG